VAKLANNLVLAISMVGVSEGMNLGVKLGMDANVLAGIFNSSVRT
jgi:3-hydroxyisobutyrate dehydrogenase